MTRSNTTYSNRVIDFFNEPGITYTDYSDFGQSALKICIEGSDTAFAEKTAARIDACSWLAFSDCDWFKFSKQGVSKGDALAHALGTILGCPCYGEEILATAAELSHIPIVYLDITVAMIPILYLRIWD